MFRLVNRIKNIGNILSRTILISFPTYHPWFSVNHFNHPGDQFKNCYSDYNSATEGTNSGSEGTNSGSEGTNSGSEGTNSGSEGANSGWEGTNSG